MVMLAVALVVSACVRSRLAESAAGVAPSQRPPSGLRPAQVPQFVSFGSDDNGYSGLEGSGAAGGLHFLTELFAGLRNPPGAGNRRTLDGTPVHYSFYVNTYYIASAQGDSAYGTAKRDDPLWVRRAWHEAVQAGHEIGNHTHSHPHGRDFTVAQWEAEMRRCTEALARPYSAEAAAGDPPAGLGISRAQALGFRTPFLEYGDATLTAAKELGFAYDCSLEEGIQDDEDGRNFFWPYTLDHGSPANPVIGRHPGLWEIPVYVFIAPPDEECERFGVPPGLRGRLHARKDYFDPKTGKITGMDWNLWCEFSMSPAEFLATIRYTLDLRLTGNRCPLTIGLHSELYSDRQQPDEECGTTTPAERRAALEDLVRDIGPREAVRMVSARELLEWLRRPAALGDAT
jgi:hypothetical protein